jgi:hypothetical protein
VIDILDPCIVWIEEENKEQEIKKKSNFFKKSKQGEDSKKIEIIIISQFLDPPIIYKR